MKKVDLSASASGRARKKGDLPPKSESRPAPPVTQAALDSYARRQGREQRGDSKVLRSSGTGYGKTK